MAKLVSSTPLILSERTSARQKRSRASANQIQLIEPISSRLGPAVVDENSQNRVPVLRAPNTEVITHRQIDLPSFLLHQGDAIAWLNSLPEESAELVITDPPYESLEKHRSVGTTTRLKRSKASSNEWFNIFPNARFPELMASVWRILKWNSHFYLFCDAETMFVVKPLAEQAGFKFWKPLVWDKKRLGMGYHYRARYEFILFFEKGKRRLTSLSIPDVIEVPRISRGYPTEKPVAVSRILIGQSTESGALVVDPFSGSGSVGVAALALGRQFWGNDSSETALQVSMRRLEGTMNETMIKNADVHSDEE